MQGFFLFPACESNMLCEECGKRPAELLLTAVVNGQTTTRSLCRECVKKYQAGDLQAILAAVLFSMTEKQQAPAFACPRCGETYQEFQKSGMLGCAACYQTFRRELSPLIARVQGRSQHAGRRPPESPEEQARQTRMEELRARMEQAVTQENFEEAARLRDELRAMAAAGEAQA